MPTLKAISPGRWLNNNNNNNNYIILEDDSFKVIITFKNLNPILQISISRIMSDTLKLLCFSSTIKIHHPTINYDLLIWLRPRLLLFFIIFGSSSS
jgi:hypothetical protein